MTPNLDDTYYLAVKSRDARFDGSFFTGVTSTGIYCRPVCKVRAPKRENCRFFGHAAQAEAAGFRPCLRCRPELAPYSLNWSIQDASRTLALQAARLLDDAAPGEIGGVAALAERLGVSDRHLRRIFEAHLGVSPLQYLQTRRLLAAKQLLTDTALPVAQIALLSGFDSLRRFNAAFVEHYRLSPTQLRKHGQELRGNVAVLLGYRPPYDVQAMLGFFQTRQVNAIEFIASHADKPLIMRTFCIKHEGSTLKGWLRGEFDTERHSVRLSVSDSLSPALPVIIRRLRAALDLDADPQALEAVLGDAFPGTEGLRVPGALSGFELAVRAVLGQQVTVAAARTFTQRVVDTLGEPIATPYPELSRLFPSAHTLAQIPPESLGALGIVKQRQAAITALSRAVDSGALDLDRPAAWESTVQALKALPGIGDWTAQYITMRALRWPDAFPAGDVALQTALKVREQDGRKLGPLKAARAAEAASQVWRPWRSYAVLRAWASLAPSKTSNAIK